MPPAVMPDFVPGSTTDLTASGKVSMVWPGTYQLDLIRYFFISASRRGAPTRGPNSPRETGVGVTAPRAMKPEIPSKSNVRQTMCLGKARANLDY